MAWTAGTVLTAGLLNLHMPQLQAGITVTAANANYTSASTAYRGGRVITVYVNITFVNAVGGNLVAANIPAAMAPPVQFTTAELIDNGSGSVVLATFATSGAITVIPSRTAGQV